MDVKTICLGVLSLGNATGYEIRKTFEDGPFSHFFDASYGSIYPALGKLLADGLVTLAESEPSGRSDKKVYSLTDAGHAALRAALAEKPGRDRVRSEHLVHLFFAHLMEPRDACRVFDDYLAHFERMAADCPYDDNNADLPPGQRVVNGFGNRLYESLAGFMREQRDAFIQEMNEAGQDTEAAE